MTSRTPIRLTPHRGPLATPSASPESSPTSSTPSTDISYCSIAIRPTLDIAILQHRIFPPSPPTHDQDGSRLHRWRREATRRSRSACLSPFALAVDSLISSTSELAKTLVGIVVFCLFIWGLLEWSSYAYEVPRRPGPWISMSRLPRPSRARSLRCHVDPSLCEPRDQHAAVLQFISEQIQHAKALSSLSVGLGLPLRSFFEAHQATIPSVVVRHNATELTFAQEVDTLTNLTEYLIPSLLDFTPGSFVGRSFTLALEELGDLIAEPIFSRGSLTHGEDEEVHLHAIYWRTASNLLLEYSAARPHVRKLLQYLDALHDRTSALTSGHYLASAVEGRSNVWWWKGIVHHPTTSVEDRMEAFVTELEVTLDNTRRLMAYLDWITEQLAQTTLRDVLETQHRAAFSSCMTSLQELFARSKPLTSKKRCFCLEDYGATPLGRPERVEIMVPGSPTVRAER